MGAPHVCSGSLEWLLLASWARNSSLTLALPVRCLLNLLPKSGAFGIGISCHMMPLAILAHSGTLQCVTWTLPPTLLSPCPRGFQSQLEASVMTCYGLSHVLPDAASFVKVTMVFCPLQESLVDDTWILFFSL